MDPRYDALQGLWNRTHITRLGSTGIYDPRLMTLGYSEMLLSASLCRFQAALRASSQYDSVLAKSPSHNFKAGTNQVHNSTYPAESKVVRDLILRVTSPSTHPLIRMQAAMDISLILWTYHGSEAEESMITSIEQGASKILSVLSTASVTSNATDDPNVVMCLCRLAISPIFRTKMVKRRCTILALTRHLSHQDATIRESILLVAHQFCVDDDCKICLYRGASENVDILREGLVNAAQVATNPKCQLILVSALQGLLHVMDEATDDVLDIFKSYAYSGTSDDVIIQSAINLTKSITPQLELIDRYLWAVADFTTFPFPEVRREALKTLEAITCSPDGIMNLLTTTELVENISLVIKRGSREDCTNILNSTRQIARSSLYHEKLLSDSDFLPCLVDVVLSEKGEHGHTSKGYATEILLSLLSNEENMDAFLPFWCLRSWLADIVESYFVDKSSREIMKAVMAKLS